MMNFYCGVTYLNRDTQGSQYEYGLDSPIILTQAGRSTAEAFHSQPIDYGFQLRDNMPRTKNAYSDLAEGFRIQVASIQEKSRSNHS